jgi:hypothetical protein
MNRFARTLYSGAATRNRSRSLAALRAWMRMHRAPTRIFPPQQSSSKTPRSCIPRTKNCSAAFAATVRSSHIHVARGTPGTARNPLLQVLHKSNYVRVAKFFAALQFWGIFDNRPHFLRQLVVCRSRRKPEPDTNSAQRTLALRKERSTAQEPTVASEKQEIARASPLLL